MKKINGNSKRIKLAIFVLSIGILAGCTPGMMIRHEMRKLDVADGVNEYEAITIAKNELITKDQAYYIHLGASIRYDENALKYPDYWFVGFAPETYHKDEFPGYLVVINKKTGEIFHSRDYYFPNQIRDLDWVFEKKN